jgi:hypothetical protein
LPAELRNKIYHYALIEPDHIRIDEDMQIPGLFSVCQQTRREAMGMYYLKNTFGAEITDCDVRRCIAFREAIREVLNAANDKSIRISISMNMRGVNWTNLVDWCYSIWKKKICASPFNGSTHVDDKVIFAAHQIAENNDSWDNCKKQLVAFRVVAGELNPKWLQ